MKRRLAIFPIIASFLFGYGCANKPAPTENYTFSFEGTKCTIDNYYDYSKTLTKGKKNVVFDIDVNQEYMLPNDGIKIDGDNATYDEENHKIIISEVKGNIKVTATARKPKFTFEGSDCTINGSPTYTQNLIIGERVSFKIDITQQDYVLLRANVLVTGKNWTFDEEKSIFTINEVASDVNVNARAKATKCTFTFTGTNCTIKSKSGFTKILNIGDKNVEFDVAFASNLVLTKNKVNITGKNAEYNEETRKIVISEVVDDINIIATASIPTFSFQGTYCTVNNSATYTQPLSVGEETTFDVVLADVTTLPKSKVEITGYNTSYNESTHKITISKVASDVVVKATAIPKSVNFTSNLTNCYFEVTPSASYPVYSEVDLRIKANQYYQLPPNVTVEPSTLDYTYNPETGALIINSMPAEDVKISAQGELGWIHIDNDYQIVLGENQLDRCQDAHQINDALDYSNQSPLKIVDAAAPSINTEIILDGARSESQRLCDTITDSDGYAIKVIDKKVVIAAKTKLARTCAVDRLLTECYYGEEGGLAVPIDYDVQGTCKKSEIITEITLPKDEGSANYRAIRDPFIVHEGIYYYLYGTTNFHGDEWRVYRSTGLSTGWELVNKSIIVGEYPDIKTDRWAPEVHKYTNPNTGETNYYMFTTYMSKRSGVDRLVVIFKSSSLTEGFEMISRHKGNGAIPGAIFDEKTCHGIDATLYVDSNKTPWMIYGGRFKGNDGPSHVLCKLTDDLTTVANDDFVNIFYPKDMEDKYWWSDSSISDAPFVTKLKDGRLVSQYSSMDKDYDGSADYAAGLLINKGGDKEIANPSKWIPQKRTIYTKDIYDGASAGGHYMIFNVGEQMYMCLHAPNWGNEHPLIFPIKEAYGTLVWDLYSHTI